MSEGEGVASVSTGLKLDIFAGGETSINAGSKYESVVGSMNDFIVGVANETVVGAKNDVVIGYHSDLSLGGSFNYDADGRSLDVNKNKSVLASKSYTIKAGMDTVSSARYAIGDKTAKVLLYGQSIGNAVTTALAAVPQFFAENGNLNAINAVQSWGQNGATWFTNLFDAIVPIVSWQYMNIEETSVPRSVISMDDKKGVFIGTALDVKANKLPSGMTGAGAYFTKDGVIKITSYKAPLAAITHVKMFNNNLRGFNNPPAGSNHTDMTLTPTKTAITTGAFDLKVESIAEIKAGTQFKASAAGNNVAELSLNTLGFQLNSGNAGIYAKVSLAAIGKSLAAKVAYETKLAAAKIAGTKPPDPPQIGSARVVGMKADALTLAEVGEGEITLTTGVTSLKMSKTEIELSGAGLKLTIGATGVNVGGALKVMNIPVPTLDKAITTMLAHDTIVKGVQATEDIKKQINEIKDKTIFEVNQKIIAINLALQNAGL